MSGACQSAWSKLKVDELTVMRLWRESQQSVKESIDAPSGADPLSVLLATSSEPAAFEYVFDAFTDMEQEDPVALSDEELEQVLAVLRTFVERLHHACSPITAVTIVEIEVRPHTDAAPRRAI